MVGFVYPPFFAFGLLINGYSIAMAENISARISTARMILSFCSLFIASVSFSIYFLFSFSGSYHKPGIPSSRIYTSILPAP